MTLALITFLPFTLALINLHPITLPKFGSLLQANSVMSSSMQPLSCISAMSSLPDEFGSTMGDHPYFQHIPSGLRNEDPDTVQQWLPDLLQLINDECEVGRENMYKRGARGATPPPKKNYQGPPY